jgi:phage terminase large subunit
VEPRLIHELRSRGNNVKETIKGAGSVSAGIALMQDYEMIIDNDSINIIKELNNYAWSDKKSNTAIDAFNHAIDAMRYAIYFN